MTRRQVRAVPVGARSREHYRHLVHCQAQRRYAYQRTVIMIARGQVTTAESRRQALEDRRANHRNLNRMLTLAGAIMIGVVVTYTIQNAGIPALGVHLPAGIIKLAPYSFVITVLLDATLALYSFIRHY